VYKAKRVPVVSPSRRDALYHGLRREELCNLRMRDLQQREGVLHFRVHGKAHVQGVTLKHTIFAREETPAMR
jgi:integrase